jgi:membrane protein implicated in regulation of membrane protease activity
MRGRVMGVYVFMFFGSMPIAAPAIGATAQRLGETVAILIGASVMLLAAVLLRTFFPRLRHQT